MRISSRLRLLGIVAMLAGSTVLGAVSRKLEALSERLRRPPHPEREPCPSG